MNMKKRQSKLVHSKASYGLGAWLERLDIDVSRNEDGILGLGEVSLRRGALFYGIKSNRISITLSIKNGAV